VICDDVCIESGALVVGPIRVGDRVTIGPGCVVSQHVPDDTVFEAATRFVLGASRSAGAAAGSVS
jgi:serine acetyltransferase